MTTLRVVVAVYPNMEARLALVLLAIFAGGAAAQPTLTRDRAPAVPGSIRGFVDRLYAPDARARADAACEIGRRHAEAAAAIPILLSMLSDDVVVVGIDCEMNAWTRRHITTNPDVQRWSQTSPAKEAAEALGDIGDAAVPGLLQALGHTDWKTRKHAAYGLGEAEPMNEQGTVIKALGERLADPHPEVRDRSAWALGELEDEAAVPALSRALRDADVRVRVTAAWALGEIEDPSAVSALVTAMKDVDLGVRQKAVWALGEIEDPSAVDGLTIALRDANNGVRRQAAWALGEIEDASAVTALGNALSDADAEVRRQAAWALGEIEDPSGVGPLTRALKDADWQVRKNAAWALGEIEDPSAIDELRAAANDSNGEVRRAVSYALRELRDKRHRR
jgi:HEAT repeat protein